MTTQDEAEQIVDRMAAKADPSEARRIDDQFARKLAGLEKDDKLPAEMTRRLHVLWKMFHAPDEDVPWSQKALIMAALAYFVSPLDIIPDMAGKPGYMDDRMIVNIVWSRLGDATTKYS